MLLGGKHIGLQVGQFLAVAHTIPAGHCTMLQLLTVIICVSKPTACLITGLDKSEITCLIITGLVVVGDVVVVVVLVVVVVVVVVLVVVVVGVVVVVLVDVDRSIMIGAGAF